MRYVTYKNSYIMSLYKAVNNTNRNSADSQSEMEVANGARPKPRKDSGQSQSL